MNNNLDINQMIEMLAKMNKKDLEEGLKKASQILQTGNQNEILSKFNSIKK